MAKTSLHAFKAKDTRFVGLADWLKSKGLHKLVLYLKVFKNHLYYLWHVRVLFIKPCSHTQLPEHGKSYRNVSRGWGHLITWNGPMMGHLNSFSASGGRNLNKNKKNAIARGVARGRCWSFDLTGTLRLKSCCLILKRKQHKIWDISCQIKWITGKQ